MSAGPSSPGPASGPVHALTDDHPGAGAMMVCGIMIAGGLPV